jgi:hypothetical protein
VGLLLSIITNKVSRFTGVNVDPVAEVLLPHVGPLLDIPLRIVVINVDLEVSTEKFLVCSMLTVI